MAIMTSDQIDHLDVAIPNSSELIHLSHRMRLCQVSRRFEEFRFSEEANIKATSSEKRNSSKS